VPGHYEALSIHGQSNTGEPDHRFRRDTETRCMTRGQPVRKVLHIFLIAGRIIRRIRDQYRDLHDALQGAPFRAQNIVDEGESIANLLTWCIASLDTLVGSCGAE